MFKAKVLVSLPSPKALALCLSNPGMEVQISSWQGCELEWAPPLRSLF